MQVLVGNALSCRAFPLLKQSTGLFEDSPFAERLYIISLSSKSLRKRPEALPLDSAKGDKAPLESHFRTIIFTKAPILSPTGKTFQTHRLSSFFAVSSSACAFIAIIAAAIKNTQRNVSGALNIIIQHIPSISAVLTAVLTGENAKGT